MYVCLKGYKDITKLILESGADISIKDNQEHKTIDYATANDLRNIISILTSDIT